MSDKQNTTLDLISYPIAFGLDLDSDQVETILANANLDPTTCTLNDALTACRLHVALIDAPPSPRRRGAPRGSKNNKRDVQRLIRCEVQLTPDEHADMSAAAAANNMPLARWMREAAMKEAHQSAQAYTQP